MTANRRQLALPPPISPAGRSVKVVRRARSEISDPPRPPLLHHLHTLRESSEDVRAVVEIARPDRSVRPESPDFSVRLPFAGDEIVRSRPSARSLELRA